MLHKEFWGMLFLAFVAWVFLSGTPDERIKSACRPVGWAGNVVVSVSALVLPDQQTRVQGYFNKFEYGCRFLTWRLFYQDAYNAWLAQQQQAKTPAAPAGAQTAPATAKTPAPAPAPTAPAQAPTAPPAAPSAAPAAPAPAK
jgi:pyruvate/2-oxoglutarate dehydrogenase complex dihydrolipoamide acyltransferase (E2) component